MKVFIAGITGWVGQALTTAVEHSDQLTLVGGLNSTGNGDVDVPLFSSPKEALEALQIDVWVDYTKPHVVEENVMSCIQAGVPVVIGTSGLTTEQFSTIKKAADDAGVGVLAGGNFAISAILLSKFGQLATQHFDHWEIIEYGSAKKADAPNGTMREIAAKMGELKKPQKLVEPGDTAGYPEARGSNQSGTQVHSVRLPGFAASGEIVFSNGEEQLRIQHHASMSAQPYVDGTLLAINKVRELKGLVRGLDQLI